MTLNSETVTGKRAEKNSFTAGVKHNVIFQKLADMDRQMLTDMLTKISLADLVAALSGADDSVKETLLSGLPARLRNVAEICINSMERGNIPESIVKKSRAVINKALVELLGN